MQTEVLSEEPLVYGAYLGHWLIPDNSKKHWAVEVMVGVRDQDDHLTNEVITVLVVSVDDPAGHLPEFAEVELVGLAKVQAMIVDRSQTPYAAVAHEWYLVGAFRGIDDPDGED